MNNGDFTNLRISIIERLRHDLPARLYAHSRGVEACACQIAAMSGNFNLIKKCSLAALLHDYAKCLPLERMLFIAHKNKIAYPEKAESNAGLLHGYISAFLAQSEFFLKDRQILSAIANHTLGKAKMNSIEKIIFISDYIEPCRTFSSVEALRKKIFSHLIAAGDLNQALLHVVEDKISTLRKLKINIDITIFKLRDSLAGIVKI